MLSHPRPAPFVGSRFPRDARSTATKAQSTRSHPVPAAFSRFCVSRPDTTRASVGTPFVPAVPAPGRDALICVIPATPDSAIPALQSTRPHICGLLKWPKAVDTSWDHCDNRSGQDIFVLLLLMNFSCFIAYWARGWSAHLSTRTRRPTLLTWLVLTRERARCAFNHSQERCSVTAPKSHGRSEYQI